jgi:hypothetical protein
MELDAFCARLGDGQGRVTPAHAPAGFGDVLFVLGDDAPGWTFELAQGDHAEVLQATDLTGLAFVRARLALRTPADVPPGLAWEVSILIDGVKHARALGAAGRTRVLTDLAANVSKLSGVHTVGVRLELVGA